MILYNYPVKINNSIDLNFYGPEGDDTIHGTLIASREGAFHLEKIPFERGDVAVDLGCNVGVVSCFIGKIWPDVMVYGFDASPIACWLARMNAMRNGLFNVTIFNKAIGKQNEKNRKFYSNSKEVSCLLDGELLKNSSEKRTDCYKCDVIKLEEIFDNKILGLDRVKFLKCDIEGNEFEVFEDLFDNRMDILDRIEYLHLEVHDYKEFNPENLRNKIREKFGNKILSL